MKTYLKDLTPDEVIRRLKAGEVVKFEEADFYYKFIDDVLCFFDGGDGVVYNGSISIHNNSKHYFETPDELKLEVGKCYKTRDGRKAFVSYYVSSINKYVGIIYGENTTRTWNPNGDCSTYCMNNDLISEWSDDDVAKD